MCMTILRLQLIYSFNIHQYFLKIYIFSSRIKKIYKKYSCVLHFSSGVVCETARQHFSTLVLRDTQRSWNNERWKCVISPFWFQLRSIIVVIFPPTPPKNTYTFQEIKEEMAEKKLDIMLTKLGKTSFRKDRPSFHLRRSQGQRQDERQNSGSYPSHRIRYQWAGKFNFHPLSPF